MRSHDAHPILSYTENMATRTERGPTSHVTKSRLHPRFMTHGLPALPRKPISVCIGLRPALDSVCLAPRHVSRATLRAGCALAQAA